MANTAQLNTRMTLLGAKGDDTPGMAAIIRSRQQRFERELDLDIATYEPLSDEELNDLVYQDFLEG